MSQTMTYDEVLRTAQSLDETERVLLVEELLGSLNPAEAAPLDDAWLAKIDRRSNELDAGTVQTIPWVEVRRRTYECKVRGRHVELRVFADPSTPVAPEESALDPNDIRLDAWCELKSPRERKRVTSKLVDHIPFDIPEIPQDEDDQ